MKQSLTLTLLLHWGSQHVLGFAPPVFLASGSRSHSLKPLQEAVNGKANGETPKEDKKRDRSKLIDSEDWLDAAIQSTLDKGGFDDSSFLVGILGDLHIDPRKMDEYEEGHDHWVPIFEKAKEAHGNVAMVSLGDLGESKNCDHNPSNPSELFAGTTLCHEMAAEFLRSFDVPYEVIGGNHDLEGIDEFRTDRQNLEVFMKAHGKPTAQFCREIADKTLLVGLGSTIFREAPFTSHEVIIDQAQIDWFEKLLQDKPADEGWKIFVFTHAPPNGSGLRVLQENHVVNGCCWLNHSNERQCKKFIELVREHRCVKAWFSGHFHLGQDYQDSITFPTIPREEGPYPNRGSCVFAQTSVMRGGTSRDGRQQSRLLRGNKDGFEICTVDHGKGGQIRLDATITYRDDSHEVGIYMHEDEAYEHDNYFKVYQPTEGDREYYCGAETDEECSITEDEPVTMDTKVWWRLSSGRVLGVMDGMLLEYDSSTLAPLGLVLSAEELLGRAIAVVDSGIDDCIVADDDDAMETLECDDYYQEREQAVIVHDLEKGSITVVQPNEDGSYWRKIVRNKIARMKEVRRVKAAIQYGVERLWLDETEAKKSVQSTWGPYTTTSGNAL
ncbi:Calcineurin-like phosphoesterase [Seminavis robusta]|uniref:Calcineurin-like phosphoesterase n=1 Tax=Seminavis robusta TaxID=568900 RepID=A0A9N8EIU0_9STRA|nr:Calcineurin-like phosphoesterase [Seminavis robusta]|eukprot:Sro1024_g232600.1 Calcineurin-like phosphoesterase (611) ;mRNA; r:9488-11574